jgi:hypothetical protein
MKTSSSDYLSDRKSAATNNKEEERRKKNTDRSALRGASLLSEEQSPMDKFIQKSCNKLEDFVRTKHRFDPHHHNDKRWHEQMRLLLQDIDGDKDRLVRVLGTYIEEEHNDYTPIADSARSFRKKFLSIERWASKANPESKEPQIIRVVRSSREC